MSWFAVESRRVVLFLFQDLELSSVLCLSQAFHMVEEINQKVHFLKVDERSSEFTINRDDISVVFFEEQS